MYVTTFYSFKGGVGRSMALTNVAYELSSLGYRVLIVDFDLEAPGLDTFANVSSARPTRGIVEFITAYLDSDHAPDVRDFVFEAPLPNADAQPIIVMPAGNPDHGYANRLGGINWTELYERHDGYLLFEDLKAQWRERLKVDYVLVDSRTGHTDVGGICTRQLPDSVVVLFLPNDQNLRGLQKVVESIREEPHFSGRPPIDLIFVASNVPYLDDEEQVLRRRLALFRKQLGYKERLLVINHYDSLSLLDQPVFTRDRQHSRLAKQYRSLTQVIQEANVHDRRGALSFLREPLPGGKLSAANVDRVASKLAAIESVHTADGEVLFGLAGVYMELAQVPQALLLLQDALRLGFSRPIVHLRLAEAYQRLAEPAKASEAAIRVFSDSSAGVDLLLRALALLRVADAPAILEIDESPGVAGLSIDERVRLAATMDRTRDEQRVGLRLLEPIIRRATGAESWYVAALQALGLALVGLGRPQTASEIFAQQRSHDGSVSAAFNEIIADWAAVGYIPREAFQRLIADFLDSWDRRNANHVQCLALASWCAGAEEQAHRWLSKAREIISQQTASAFSCWRYLRIAPAEFIKDLDQMEELFSGSLVTPPFIAAENLE